MSLLLGAVWLFAVLSMFVFLLVHGASMLWGHHPTRSQFWVKVWEAAATASAFAFLLLWAARR